MQDTHLLEKPGHFDRERILERVVHAKGAGAHGYFEVYGEAKRLPCSHPNDDFFQPAELYRGFMTDEARDHLIGNITPHPGKARKRIQLRQTAIFY